MDNEILALAKELIAVPSVSGDVQRAVEVLEIIKKYLPGYEFTSFVSDGCPSLLFSNQGKTVRNFKIILNGHLDVVNGSPEQFTPFVENGRLYGRGAFDMKAAVAVKILLFKQIAKQLSFPVALQLTADEEIGGINGTGYQVAQGVRGEFVVIGESNSNFKIGNQAKGRYEIKLTATGRTAHSAYAWLGRNAVLEMYEVLEKIMHEFPPPKEETFKSVVSVTRIETDNNVLNRIPDNCSAYLDIRYTKEDADTIIAKISSFLPQHVTMVVDHSRTFHYVDPDSKYIALLKKEAKAVLHQNLPLRYAHGTSDATYFTEVGCDAIEFGPIGDGAHDDNEWVDIASLGHYSEILKNFLLSVASMD